MFCKIALISVRLAALAALERFLPGVLPRVLVQITNRGTSIVALVTFEQFLSCVHSVFSKWMIMNAKFNVLETTTKTSKMNINERFANLVKNVVCPIVVTIVHKIWRNGGRGPRLHNIQASSRTGKKKKIEDAYIRT